MFYRGAEKLLNLQAQVLADCRRLSVDENILRVGNVEHQALLSEVTEAFSVKYPNVRIQRVIHPNHSGEYRVIHNIMDVAETFYSPVLAHMPASYTRLIDLPYKAAVGQGHPLAKKASVSLNDLSAYRTVVFRQMIEEEHLTALTAAFRGKEERLDIRTDVDNQVPVAFACAEEGSVLLSANYFLYHLPQMVLLPLEEGWKQEYGILYRSPPGMQVKKYVDLAVEIFREKQMQIE